MTDPILVTTRELAARLGVCRETVTKWALERPDLRACRFGTRRWKLAEVERLMGVRK